MSRFGLSSHAMRMRVMAMLSIVAVTVCMYAIPAGAATAPDGVRSTARAICQEGSAKKVIVTVKVDGTTTRYKYKCSVLVDAATLAAQRAAEKAAKDQAAAAATAKAAAAKRDAIDSDGTYAVGPEKNPGRWRTDGSSSCYWAILNAPSSGGIDNIVDNDNPGGQAFADLADGQFFETQRCGIWTRIG